VQRTPTKGLTKDAAELEKVGCRLNKLLEQSSGIQDPLLELEWSRHASSAGSASANGDIDIEVISDTILALQSQVVEAVATTRNFAGNLAHCDADLHKQHNSGTGCG
jgi:hypothetical protein